VTFTVLDFIPGPKIRQKDPREAKSSQNQIDAGRIETLPKRIHFRIGSAESAGFFWSHLPFQKPRRKSRQ